MPGHDRTLLLAIIAILYPAISQDMFEANPFRKQVGIKYPSVKLTMDVHCHVVHSGEKNKET